MVTMVILHLPVCGGRQFLCEPPAKAWREASCPGQGRGRGVGRGLKSLGRREGGVRDRVGDRGLRAARAESQPLQMLGPPAFSYGVGRGVCRS